MAKPASSARERVRESRERRRLAGLKRVEVFVPHDKVDMVKAYVAQLREGSSSEAREKVRLLLGKAYRNFQASCLDNIQIDPAKADFADAAIVAAALMHRGNADAYKLGRQIRSLVR
ncbi:MAG: hypothetical protein Q8N31_22390 [Reyranella sp.]|nr:hypothetical protein [Reyranella sp.]MDP3162769.1 hypothetical protein [Reyranella sp.]